MLLTPEQFLRQESYIDDLFGWLLRYCVAGTGLVGGGVRVDAAVRGVDRFDPRVEVQDDGVTVRAAVLQARGITPQGEPVEITDQNIARGEFRKADLAGLNELLVFVQRSGGKEEDAASVGLDPANPNQAALRRPRYRVHLGAEADQLAASLAVAQIRRASQTLSFELDGQFIPPCATVLAHSALYSSWLGLQAEVLQLAGQFAELHRTVARYADQIA